MALTKIKTKNIKVGSITTDKISPVALSDPKPKITSVVVANSNYYATGDTVVDPTGGYVIVTGSNFENGSIVSAGQTTALSTTYVNSTTLHAQLDSATAQTYNLYVVNTDGSVGLKVNGVTYSNPPTWVTNSTLDDQTLNSAFNLNFSANDAVSYANTSAIPAGTTLLSNGYLYGTVTGISEDTTYNFTVRATDAENQTSDRTFSLTVLASMTLLMGYTAGLPGGITVTQSNAIDGNRPASKMFDNSIEGEAACWHTSSGAIPAWAVIDFGATPRKIRQYEFMRRNGNDNYPTNYQMQGSNDGTNWTTLDTQTNNPPPATDGTTSVASNYNAGKYVQIVMSTTGTYRYYRFYVSATNTNQYCIVGEMLIYT